MARFSIHSSESFDKKDSESSSDPLREYMAVATFT